MRTLAFFLQLQFRINFQLRLAQIIGTAIFLECCLELTIGLHLVQNWIQLCGQCDTRQRWLNNGIIQAELEIEGVKKIKIVKVCTSVEHKRVCLRLLRFEYPSYSL